MPSPGESGSNARQLLAGPGEGKLVSTAGLRNLHGLTVIPASFIGSPITRDSKFTSVFAFRHMLIKEMPPGGNREMTTLLDRSHEPRPGGKW